MKKISLAAILFIGCLETSFAQTNDAPAASGKKECPVEQFVGVQMNGLIRQVFNFNNSTSSTEVNPYLLTYDIVSKKSGWGIRVGAGYSYNSSSNDDGITASTSKINDLHIRLGIEKGFKLTNRWDAGVGLDAVYNNNNDNTSSMVRSSDTVTTTNKTVGSSYGGGPVGWLVFNLTERLQIGTEASFYYTTGQQKNTVDITTNPFGGGGITTVETTSKPTITQGTFESPIVFYLIVKF